MSLESLSGPINRDESAILSVVKDFIVITAASLCLVLLVGSCFLSSPTPNPPVIFDPPAGSYEAAVEVSMAPLPPYSTVRFTVDGSDPDASSELYSSPISISSTTTIRGIAIHSNGAISSIVAAEYIVSQSSPLQTAKPQFSPAPGSYPDPTSVTLTSSTPGATIRFTIDGSEPTALDEIYTAPIAVDSTRTIRAVAFSSALPESEIATGLFVIGSGGATAGLTELFAYSGNGYDFTDYSLGGSIASLTVDSLNAGDSLLLLPLYESDSEHLDGTGNPEPEIGFEISYSGDPPPAGVQASTLPNRRPALTRHSLADLIEDIPPDDAGETPSFRERNRRAGILSTPNPHDPGDVIPFWFEANYGVGDYTSVSSTVSYVGTTCYVVMTGSIASHPGAASYAANLGSAFDTNIYPRITALFGYEWGGDPGEISELGGIDGEARVYIVLNSVTANPPGGGYIERRINFSTPMRRPGGANDRTKRRCSRSFSPPPT